MKDKIRLFILIFCVAFFCVSLPKIYYVLAVQFAFDENIPEVQYNLALRDAKNGNFQSALLRLPHTLESYNNRLFELSGDILFAIHSATGAIWEKYQKSLDFQENPRVRYKISLLNEENPQKSSEKKLDDAKQENEKDELHESRMEIINDQTKRGEFLNPHRSSGGEFEKNLEHLKHMLQSDTVIQKKDW